MFIVLLFAVSNNQNNEIELDLAIMLRLGTFQSFAGQTMENLSSFITRKEGANFDPKSWYVFVVLYDPTCRPALFMNHLRLPGNVMKK